MLQQIRIGREDVGFTFAFCNTLFMIPFQCLRTDCFCLAAILHPHNHADEQYLVLPLPWDSAFANDAIVAFRFPQTSVRQLQLPSLTLCRLSSIMLLGYTMRFAPRKCCFSCFWYSSRSEGFFPYDPTPATITATPDVAVCGATRYLWSCCVSIWAFIVECCVVVVWHTRVFFLASLVLQYAHRENVGESMPAGNSPRNMVPSHWLG